MEASNSVAIHDEKDSDAKTVTSSPEVRNARKHVISSETTDDAKENLEKSQADNSCASNRLCRFPKIKINKPLIFLKIALFSWYSGSTAIMSFYLLYLKQQGLSVDQLSLLFAVVPFIHLMGPTVSGIVSDKLGRSKPVLQANLLVTLVLANTILLIPLMKITSCSEFLTDCYTQSSDNTSVVKLCELESNASFGIICTFHCSSEPPVHGNDICFKNYISECHFTIPKTINHNFTFSGDVVTEDVVSECAEKYEIHNKSISNASCFRYITNNCTSTCKRGTNDRRRNSHCDTRVEVTLLFVLLMVFLTLFSTFVESCFRIFDVTTRSMLISHGSTFGRQYVWSAIASGVSPSFAGCLIYLASPQNGTPRYDVAFYFFDVMAILSVLVVWKLDITIDSPAKDMLKKTAMVLKNTDILTFTCSVFVIGIAFNFKSIFYMWYLEDLGASSILLGLVPGMGDLIGIPFIFTSHWFVEKLGTRNLVILALVAYCVRFIGYSFLINPWWTLIYDTADILTYHLLWIAVVSYSGNMAPIGLSSTLIATEGALHFSLGKGAASLVGGLVMSKYGGKTAFRSLAIICAVTAALYALYSYSRRHHKEIGTSNPEVGADTTRC